MKLENNIEELFLILEFILELKVAVMFIVFTNIMVKN